MTIKETIERLRALARHGTHDDWVAFRMMEQRIQEQEREIALRDRAMRSMAAEMSLLMESAEKLAALREDVNTPKSRIRPVAEYVPPVSPRGKKRIEEIIRAALETAKEKGGEG